MTKSQLLLWDIPKFDKEPKSFKKEDICKKLKLLRAEAKITQQEVADYLQIDRSNYSKYELGKLDISVELVFKLSQLYDVSADYILGLKDY